MSLWPDTLQTKWSIKGNKTVTIVKWRNVKGIIQSRKIFMRQKAIPCIVKINGVMYHYCLILSFYEKLPFFNQTIKKEIENYVARKWVCAHTYSKEKRIILVNNDINQKNCESIGNKIMNCVRLTNSITRNVVFWCMNRVTNIQLSEAKNCVQSSFQIILPMTSILHISIVSMYHIQ